MALVNGGFLPYTDMKKSLKNLFLRNRWSDFEIISHEPGFDISGCPSLYPNSGCNCYGQAAFATCEPASKVFSPLSSIWVFFTDTSSFLAHLSTTCSA